MGRQQTTAVANKEAGGALRRIFLALTGASEWVVLGAIVAMMLAAAAAFGENWDPCYEAYLASGLSQQQVGFEEFRELYGDGLCAPGGGAR